MSRSHSFACDIDYMKNGQPSTQALIGQQLEYTVKFYDLFYKKDREPKNARRSEYGNAILVEASFFEPKRMYAFMCEVNYVADGKRYNGKAWKLYNTVRRWTGEVEFTVSPTEGIPLRTEFTFKVDKWKAKEAFKCEFGYYNYAGKVVIPTEDTGDYLGRNLTDAFTRD